LICGGFKIDASRDNGQNGYVEILIFSGRLATAIAARLRHIIRNINTNILAFQTHRVGGSS
jgi:hypothetical protein